jgi:hypothetical protein
VRRRLLRGLFAGLIALIAISAQPPALARSRSIDRTCSGAWELERVPQPGSQGDEFEGVAAISDSDVWAVGHYVASLQRSTTPVNQPLMEHWDGAQWLVETGPDTGSDGLLLATSASGPSDVWAVGISYPSSGVTATLIEHWDGAQWTIVPSPSPGATVNELNGVFAVSRTDAWAVGRSEYRTLTEHWDGAA